MSITHDEYRIAEYMLRPAAERLKELVWPDRRGARAPHPLILLMGMHFGIKKYGNAQVTTAYRFLTHDLPRDLQWKLGVRTSTPGTETLISISSLYSMTKRISSRLDYTQARQCNLTDDERARRITGVESLTAAFLAPTLPPRPDGSCDYAVDGTGISAFERAPRKPGDASEFNGHEEDQKLNDVPAEPTAEPEAEVTVITTGKGAKGASDAKWGWRTAKDGGRDNYFGYDVEAIIRVPAIGQTRDNRNEPCLVAAMVVLPASTDIVAPVLNLIDGLAARGENMRRLLVDRHYSYKAHDRWLSELQKREIAQVCDLHENDQGFVDWDGVKFAASHPHCPHTPDDLGIIPTLPPRPTHDQRTEFERLIRLRQQYAMQLVERPTHDRPRIKFRCPARNGSLGCPLVDGTVAAATELAQPIVEPVGDPLPVCQQDTATVRIETPTQKRAMKTLQPDYWGSSKWRESYNRRTYIEGFFGCLKNQSIAGVDHETSQFRGLALANIVLAMSVAIGNAHALVKWHETTGKGDPEHPLLTTHAPFHGYIALDADQAHTVDIQAQHETNPTALRQAS